MLPITFPMDMAHWTLDCGLWTGAAHNAVQDRITAYNAHGTTGDRLSIFQLRNCRGHSISVCGCVSVRVRLVCVLYWCLSSQQASKFFNLPNTLHKQYTDNVLKYATYAFLFSCLSLNLFIYIIHYSYLCNFIYIFIINVIFMIITFSTY